MLITTIEEAMQELAVEEHDVVADMGEETLEAGWYDIVHNVASYCTPEVAAELIRRNT